MFKYLWRVKFYLELLNNIYDLVEMLIGWNLVMLGDIVIFSD